jgi:O-antigen ligase
MSKANSITRILKNHFDGSSRDRICSAILEYGLLGILVFSPLPAASVFDWSILVIQLAVAIMFVAYLIMKQKPQNDGLLLAAAKWPGYLFLAFFGFLFIQILPLPKFLVSVLSPGAYSYQKLYAADFSRLKFLSLSLVPSYTLRRGLELLTYCLLGFLVLRTVTKRYQIMRLYSVLVAMGVFEAFYGLLELYNKNPRILFYKKSHNLDSVTGTFVNRNHFSGYLEMIIPLAIGLIIARLDLFSAPSRTLREKILRLSERNFSKNVVVFLGIILMAIAVVFSQSRSGVVLLVLTFIFFSALVTLFIEGHGLRKKTIRKFLQVSFLLVTVISLYVGIDAMLQRFAMDRPLQEGRATYWANTLKTFAAYPLYGTGLGTFGVLYPDMDTPSGPVALVHAHNDYLEYLSELGLIGFALLLGAIAAMMIFAFRAWRARRHPEVKGLAMGGIVSLLCILIHSLTDFNLHIPANMVLFSVVLPLTMVVAFYKRAAAPQEKK